MKNLPSDKNSCPSCPRTKMSNMGSSQFMHNDVHLRHDDLAVTHKISDGQPQLLGSEKTPIPAVYLFSAAFKHDCSIVQEGEILVVCPYMYL